MNKPIPRFVRRRNPNGDKVTFVTATRDGKKQELSLWDLINKYGADKVLEMREQFPEEDIS